MRQRQTLSTILALGILLVSPLAWACEGAGVQDCSMSNCPMPDQQGSVGCHESEASTDHSLSDCGADLEMWIACCEAPVDPEPAKLDAASSSTHGTTPLVVLAEQVEVDPPARPPDLIAEAISSQQHELGRFTFLSSFLL